MDRYVWVYVSFDVQGRSVVLCVFEREPSEYQLLEAKRKYYDVGNLASKEKSYFDYVAKLPVLDN